MTKDTDEMEFTRYVITTVPGIELSQDKYVFIGGEHRGINLWNRVNILDGLISKLNNPKYEKISFPLHVTMDNNLPKYIWQDNGVFSIEDLKYIVEKLDADKKVILVNSVLCPGSDKLDDILKEYGLDKYEIE